MKIKFEETNSSKMIVKEKLQQLQLDLILKGHFPND